MKRTHLILALCLFAGMAVRAGDYPVRPIQVIVPYSAGGGTDLAVRLLAESVKKTLPTGMVVLNQPGGGGSIGTSAISHAAPDGYTIGTGSQGPLCLLPHYGGTDYTKDDFEYIAFMGRNLMCLAVGKRSPVQSAEELVEYCKNNPNKFTIANSGAGGANHLMSEGLARAAGIEIKAMPFNGAANAITAAVGGHVNAVVAHPSELVNHVKSGNLTVILVASEDRIKEFPDAPTTDEVGIPFHWAAWKGIVGPRNMPEDVRAILADAIETAMKDPDFLQKMADLGEYVEFYNGADFKKLCDADSEQAETIIRSLGLYGMNAGK
ncbi:MAG: tripartite tricarboxylate transporter substrate binding protein [Planctomycetes bacterium]|nr:tripartite tricarboxylate transporter substrate binding protein [Planctomycetota bacterium]